MNIDFHTHTTASDGLLSPTELIQQAITADIDMLAITDHDSTNGLAEAYTAVQNQNLQLISGIEFSVSWTQTVIHIVGLNIDSDNAHLQAGIATLQQTREERAQRMSADLNKAGITNAYEGARKFAGNGTITRTHFAHYLVSEGYAKNVSNVFKHYLVRGKRGYAPAQWASLEEAVGWINGAGGIAVVAHPQRYKIGSKAMLNLLADFTQAGGRGIEISSGNTTDKDIRKYGRLANKHQLLASIGSDYHGAHQSWNHLGRKAFIPEGLEAVWQHFH